MLSLLFVSLSLVHSRREALPSPPAFSLSASCLSLPPLDNLLVRALVVPRLRAQRRKTPRRLRVIAFASAFTATVRMVHRVHGHTANRRPAAVPARPARFAVGNVFVIQITHLADGGHAVDRKLANFARGQLHQGEITFLAEKLRCAARRAHHLAAAAGIQLEVVHRSEEHTSELQSRLHLVCRLLLEKKKKDEISDDQ